ncbi:MAG: PD40 domain-containing protein [Verrucomicrobia bacterium]|nr:PD40 domain-containing protein [Verrucomicrobiota bacterium]MCH8513572.1 hypothetical protein [Kiritimatiellia bacterium]
MLCLVLFLGSALTFARAEELPPHLQDGFVVWESNRSGSWRIYRQDFAEDVRPRQVTPEEPDREHLAAHISPDGKRMVYLSFPKGQSGYNRHNENVIIPMYLLAFDSDEAPKKILENARPYGQHRAAVWLDDHELITIDAHYYAQRLDLRTGETTRMVHDMAPERNRGNAYLVDPTLQYAFYGRPGFFDYDQETQKITQRSVQGGCQPLITRDGVWGYWVQGSGGPINRIHLATGQTGTVLGKNDARMPDNQSYIYFPQVSPCRQLIAYSASSNQHDHHKSNYDIFVAPLDPATLEINGTPVRITSASTTDRFPDVYARPLQLGLHAGKAPYQVAMSAEEDLSGWTWRVNDQPAQGPELTFTEPGQYTVVAERDGELKRGRVSVLPPTPPTLVSSALSRNGEIMLTFNENVRVDQARFRIDGQSRHLKILHDPDTPFVRLVPESPASDSLELEIRGISDTAQRPNVMPTQTVKLTPSTWPVNPDGLILAWEDGQGLREMRSPGDNRIQTLNLTPRNRARFTAHHTMILDGGSFLAPDADALLLEAFQTSGEITLEAVIQARRSHQTGPARILTFSQGTGTRNFTLGQERDQFVIRLRTDNTSRNAHERQIELGPVNTERPVHLTVTYRPGELTAYLDGVKSVHSTAHRGDFSSWEPYSFHIGAESDNGRDWAGALEGVAIYNRCLDAQEVAANAEQAAMRLAARTPVPSGEVEARLVAVTPVPRLSEIEPYREIMVAHEYELVRTLNGIAPPKRFRVYHWGLLDGQAQPLPVTEPGKTATLQLQPFEAHAHLQDIYPADTLEPDFDIPVYLDIAP